MDNGWTELKAAYSALVDARDRETGLDEAWDRFAGMARASAARPPFHLQAILAHLSEAQGQRAKEDVGILDHGCGGGFTLLYLLALGYPGIHGVDIGGHCEAWNPFLERKFGLTGRRFAVYDGRRLPFEDASFDFVFSEEVVEHIRADALEPYYREERRVLKPGGLAFHRVPHRLTPYESHTQRWLIHYLPRPIWLRILRARGHNMLVPETALFLRWPWIHRRLARRHLGDCEDRTIERFLGLSDLTHYEGPKGLRRIVAHSLRLPVAGKAIGALAGNFLMLDTVSRKPERP